MCVNEVPPSHNQTSKFKYCNKNHGIDMIHLVQTSMLRVVVLYKKTETLATRGSSVHCEVPVPCDIMSLPGASFK